MLFDRTRKIDNYKKLEEDDRSKQHPHFSMNKKMADWLSNERSHLYEEIFISSLDNRMEISWDYRNMTYCNPISFNECTQIFKCNVNDVLHQAKHNINQKPLTH